MAGTRLTDAQREAIRQSKVADAYKMLFGDNPKKRTESQQIVWDDMQKVGSVKSPVFVAGKDGAMCPLKAAHLDGRRWVWLYIEANVTAKITIPE